MKKILIAITLLSALSSCSNYYKAITTSSPNMATRIEELNNDNKFFILRDGNRALAMYSVAISADRKHLQCRLEELPVEHQLYVTSGAKGNMKYKEASANENQTAVLYEAHVYVSPGNNSQTGPYTVSLDKIQKIEVLEKDKQRTKKSHTKGTLIAIGATVVSVALISTVAVAASLANGF